METVEIKSLKKYLMSNAFTPTYITLNSEIQTKLEYVEHQMFVGTSYLQNDPDGEPFKVEIPENNFYKFLSRLGPRHVVYTVGGMKKFLDKLDKSSPKSK